MKYNMKASDERTIGWGLGWKFINAYGLNEVEITKNMH
jgi:hypothetical protein